MEKVKVKWSAIRNSQNSIRAMVFRIIGSTKTQHKSTEHFRILEACILPLYISVHFRHDSFQLIHQRSITLHNEVKYSMAGFSGLYKK